MFNLAFVAQTAKEPWACQSEFQLQFCQAPKPSFKHVPLCPHAGPRALDSPVLQGALNI